MSNHIALQNELSFYEKNKKEYLKRYLNQFVLIKGEDLVGTFTTEEEAYRKGVEEFGNENFLIKQVLNEEKTISFSTLFYGLRHASL